MKAAVPDKAHRCWLTLATGGHTRIQTRQLALQLLFKRIQSDPSPPARKAEEIHAFFLKYAAVLFPEINQLDKL